MSLYKILKRCRVVLSLLIIIGIASCFSFVRAEATDFLAPLLKLQLVPALLASFSGAFAVFAALLLLTLLFGRVYCSLLCPLGTLQDISLRVANLFKSKKQKRFRYTRQHSVVRYSILAVVAACWIAGFSLPLLALDPYSNFGRFATHLFKPVVIWLNNHLSYVGPDTFYCIGFTWESVWMYVTIGLLFLTIMGLSAFRGRLFCNTVCPAGSFLGLISKYSAFRLVVDKSKCNHCAVCGKKCKAECIDTRNGLVDHSRCVACLNCTLACSQEAIRYSFSWRKERDAAVAAANGSVAVAAAKGSVAVAAKGSAAVTSAKDSAAAASAKDSAAAAAADSVKRIGRRAFFASASGLAGAAVFYRFAGGKPLACAHSKNLIAPPGAISYVHLKEFCTACQACISVCPSQIIRPSFSGYGMDGLMLPYLDFTQGFCRYDCNLCMQVCPSKALVRTTIEEKKLIQTGKAKFYPKYCVVSRSQTDCGACDEHCPTKAVKMVRRGNKGLSFPVIDEKYCIGCGGCEYICPTTPKAIVVEAQAEHGVALPPPVEKQEAIEAEGFGF